MMPALLTSRAVQQLLNVDRSTIYRMADDGRLPAIKVGRQWRFHAEAIEQWVRDGSGGTPHAGIFKGTPPQSLDVDSTQAISDLTADLLGVMVIVTDMEGQALCNVSNPCGLHQAIANHPLVQHHQIEEHRKLCATSGLAIRLTSSYLGLLCARSFIRVGTRLAGVVIVGGIAPEVWPPPPNELDRLSRSLDLPLEDLAPHLDEVYRVGESSQQRIVEILPKVADLISTVAGSNAAGPGFVLNSGPKDADTREIPHRMGEPRNGRPCDCEQRLSRHDGLAPDNRPAMTINERET